MKKKTKRIIIVLCWIIGVPGLTFLTRKIFWTLIPSLFIERDGKVIDMWGQYAFTILLLFIIIFMTFLLIQGIIQIIDYIND